MSLQPVSEIIARNVSVDPESGCWTWKRSTDRDGYGQTWIGPRATRRLRFTHRLSYEHFVGPIPDGMQIDHLCRNRACCNPVHLDVVTTQENTRRRDVAMRRDEVCRNGHPRTAANTYVSPGGQRACRECRDLWLIRAGLKPPAAWPQGGSDLAESCGS